MFPLTKPEALAFSFKCGSAWQGKAKMKRASQVVWASTAPGTKQDPFRRGVQASWSLGALWGVVPQRLSWAPGLLRFTFDRLWPLHGLEEEEDEALQEVEAVGPSEELADSQRLGSERAPRCTVSGARQVAGKASFSPSSDLQCPGQNS